LSLPARILPNEREQQVIVRIRVAEILREGLGVLDTDLAAALARP
jgi:hypothetical protein